ncbi:MULTISPECIES: hypothetical protein [Nosocomiicoccus]|uniref:hypothetical protein n=1 Tax=Nosocomiicoccus TaxID=489909 RepID=UPI000428FA91|nr:MULTISPECIES: hypothetical protein [Nosocomiicoccus]OFO50068.1 hypothetical protein HMPREF3029_08415 [Nosocomiicoccus sp. HMSC059G07]
MYPVIQNFSDLDDNNRIYIAGRDKYPRKGYKPTKERIKVLQSSKNNQKRPVIGDEIKTTKSKK